MKDNRILKFWNGIYPFLLIFVVFYFSTYGVIGLLPKWDPMIMLSMIQVILILVMMKWMKEKKIEQIKIDLTEDILIKEEPRYKGWKLNSTKKKWLAVFLIMIISGLFSMALNQLIDASKLKELSPAYQMVSNLIYQPGRMQIICCVGLIAPAFEELLYRGVLFGQLRRSYSFLFSAVISALIFGGLHLNLVQFVYAFAMGYLFAFFFEKSGNVWFAIVAHVTANLTSLITTWCGSASWMFEHGKISLLVALIEGLVGILLLNTIMKKFEILK